MSTATTARRRSALPAELRSEQITAITDSREQYPLDLAPLRTVTATLTTGDYSVVGLESIVAIERKELGDLLSCVGVERERFEREIQRLLAYPVRAIVVESTWAVLESGGWRPHITAAAAVGSCIGWIAAGVPIVMAGDHARAGRFVARLLCTAARREWRKCRTLAAGIIADEGDNEGGPTT
jgi:ERCC4-type nuclease